MNKFVALRRVFMAKGAYKMFMLIRRHYNISSGKFELLPEFKLKCGLEIHTQLNTRNKLFSLSTNDPYNSISKPNTNTSYFDIALPGTQPILNYEAVSHAIKLSLALGCQVNLNSQFDRKHYFYGDQPMGYQITQHYSPISSGGHLTLYGELDNIDETAKKIKIIQLQIEQDTGKSTYDNFDDVTLIDLNRSNVPLIEMVTDPDFTDLKQIRSFIRKYQNLVRHLNVSTGDLESGSMRVDVNVSINDYPRVELKNLANTSSILNAVKYEYQRQVEIIKDGKADEFLLHPETRGWTGSSTVKLRSKETTIDYRYMPDPELPLVTLSPTIVEKISRELPILPDQLLHTLTAEPYSLSLKDAKILTINSNSQNEYYCTSAVMNFYFNVFQEYSQRSGTELNSKLPINWIIHELLGDLNKLQLPLNVVQESLTPNLFGGFLMLMHNKYISNASAKLLLFHILNKIKMSNTKIDIDFYQLIEEFNLKNIISVDSNELRELCRTIVYELNDVKLLDDIASGRKKGSLKFLVGQGMRASQGKINAKELEGMFKKILKIQW